MQNREEYITKTIEKHSDMVYRLALARCASIENAEDIFQEVFLKFSEKLPKFNSEEHEKAWLIKVTINLTKNLNKSSWVRNTVELDENFVGETETKDENEVFDKVMNLPQEYRTVIYLFYYEGYKVKEISEMMNKTEGTIKTWLFRAREQLKNELEGGFGDE
jgi:RNA polymerase sigma-70 factor (ECF subfamily)